MFDNVINWWTHFKNQDFMESVVAGCALVAFADGKIDSAEKQKMIGLFQRLDELKVFSTKEVIAAFNKFIDLLNFDLLVGKQEALKTIRKIRSNQEFAKTLVRICCSIGAADGNFDDNEKAIVAEICRELNVNPGEFNL